MMTQFIDAYMQTSLGPKKLIQHLTWNCLYHWSLHPKKYKKAKACDISKFHKILGYI